MESEICKVLLSTEPPKLADARVGWVTDLPFPRVDEDCSVKSIESLFMHYPTVLVLKDGMIDSYTDEIRSLQDHKTGFTALGTFNEYMREILDLQDVK